MFASQETQLNLQHLQAELARIDALIRHQVRRWQRAGQDPSDAFRGLYVSDAQADGLLARPFGSHWGQAAILTAQEIQAFHEAETQATRQAQALVETVHQQGGLLRLEHLAHAFDLNRFDMNTLLICLAPTLDLRYERLYGYLQDDVTRKRPTINLVLDLLGPSGPERLPMLARLADDAPLIKYDILERLPEPARAPWLSQTLYVDETIVAWLLGRYQPHADLGPCASLIQPEARMTDQVLATPWEGQLDLAATRLNSGEPPLLVFFGPDRLSQRAVARQLAARTGRALLTVDLAAVIEGGVLPPRALRLALRDARLTGAVPFLTGWDAGLLAEGQVGPSPALLAELCAYPDWVIVAGEKAWQPEGVDRRRTLVWLEFPIPAHAQRLALWEHFLSQRAAAGGIDLSTLAGQFGLTSGQIRDAVASAHDRAAQAGRPLQNKDLLAAARAHSNPHLGSLARKIDPRYGWEDIILPEDQLALLREIAATVRGRPLVLDEWGVGRKLASSAGVTVLFSGPPGTGKTMAAEVIAAELGLDLYKIDLSTVVSKYIGETEKNLEKIFHEAQSSNAILFFDEADAIFGKRSEVKDAHDRYANIEISYLLQRMEAYDGVTILATNLRANLDEAFTRRLQFALDFPFPEADYRLRIWQTLFPPETPRDAEIDFGLLARRFRLAGGNIRNIIVSAAYLAAADGRAVTMSHLLHGTRRELQKMGRLVGEEDFQF